MLRPANDLQTVGVEVIVKALELQSRPVQVRDGEHGLLHVGTLMEHLQREVFDEFCDLDALALHGVSSLVSAGADPLPDAVFTQSPGRVAPELAVLFIIYEFPDFRNTFPAAGNHGVSQIFFISLLQLPKFSVTISDVPVAGTLIPLQQGGATDG